MFLKRKLRLHSQYFPQNSLTLTESSGKFSDLHSTFRLRALRYLDHVMIRLGFDNCFTKKIIIKVNQGFVASYTSFLRTFAPIATAHL